MKRRPSPLKVMPSDANRNVPMKSSGTMGKRASSRSREANRTRYGIMRGETEPY
jgi:hypothetical protein